MKALTTAFFSLLLVLFLIPSCNDDDNKTTNLEVIPEVLNFQDVLSTQNANIRTNVEDWTAEVNADAIGWCTATKKDGITLSISLAANGDLTERTAQITVKAKELQKTITVNQLGSAPQILLEYDRKEIDSKSATISIQVTANIDYEILPKVDWIKKVELETPKMTGETIQLTIEKNTETKRREGIVEFKQKGGTLTKSMTVVQKGYTVGLEDFKADIKVKVATAQASEAQPDTDIDKTIDGDFTTFYHSRWGGNTSFPVTLTYNFDKVDIIDYIVVSGRSDGTNGHFKQFKLYAKENGGAETLVGDYDFNGEGLSKNLSIGISNPQYIKFVVSSGVGDFVSCGEIEFYKNSEGSALADNIFTNKSYSELKPGVTLEQIATLNNGLLQMIGEQLYHKTYQSAYRVQKYKATKSPSKLGAELKIGDGFSRYENMTGIYLEKGENIVFVSGLKSKQLGLLLPNWMRQPTPGYPADKDPEGWGLKKQTFALKEGINIIEAAYSTNAYLSYYDDAPETAPEITVHFPTGKVNGYFDADKQTDADWNKLLDEAVSPMMDARGKYIQVAYPVAEFKDFAYGKGLELINNYDKMLLSHYTFMGLKKYNRLPNNRILARVNFNYYMFRDNDGVAYLGNKSTMGMVVNPAAVIKGDPCWGFSHEVGHVLQMRPQLNWGGLGEVSNNFYSMYTTTGLGNASRIKTEGRYQSAREKIINATPKVSYLTGGVDFERLIPFWQLHLYFNANGKPDFYADLMERLRNQPHLGTGNEAINNQFEFMKLACDVGKTDLTEFFDKWGFFYVGTIELEDYGTYKYQVTQATVDGVKSYIKSKNYSPPVVDITTLEDAK